MTVATAIVACAVFFFLVPSHASISSVSGLSIVLSNFIPFKVSQITMFLNVILLIIGFLTCGKDFGYKTVYTSILLPILIGILEVLFPNFVSLTGSDILDAAGYLLLVSVGISMLFVRNASSGGMDIVAKIMNKYLHMDLGKAMGLSGMVVALSSALAYDSRTVVISVIGTYLNGIVLDHFIFGQSVKRRVCIVSKQQDIVRDYILNELHSGATIYEAYGAYHMDKRTEIITIVDRSEYQKLMNWIMKNDPEAFVTVYTVSSLRYMPKEI